MANIRITLKPKEGLGDKVEKVAKPIARTLKKVTGGRVDLTNCGGCTKRREFLNRLSR